MRTAAVGANWKLTGDGRQCAQHKRGPSSPHGQGEHRPHLLERMRGSKALVSKRTGRNHHAIVERDLERRARDRTEDRFAVAERIAELSVVAIEQEVGSNRKLLLR